MRRPEEGQAAAAAFWEFLEPVKGKVYNYVLKSVNFSQDADDVYQESVLRALRYFQTFRKEASF